MEDDDDALGLFNFLNGGNHGNRQTSPQVHIYPTQAGGDGAGALPAVTAEDIARFNAAFAAHYQALANQNANAFGSSQHLSALQALQQAQMPVYWLNGMGTLHTYPAPEPPPHEGIRAGEVIGYRCWQVIDGRLCSVAVNTPWYPNGPMKASDGDLDRGVGVFAYNSEKALMTDGTGYWCSGNVSTFALGTVEMWGEIVEHEKGYRAEYAAVASITELHNGTEDELNELRHTYGLPFKPYLKVKQPGPKPIDHDLPMHIMGIGTIAALFLLCLWVI